MNTSATRLLVFIVVIQSSVLALTLPARAQLLADAVQEPRLTRESVQRAVAATLAHPGIDLAVQAAISTSTEWSQVMGLAPGTSIIVTVAGEGDRREFVSADESTLTVRNFRERTNVEVIARPDITEVHTVVVGGGGGIRAGRTARRAVGGFLGYLGGGFLGGMAGFAFTNDDSNLSPMFLGMVAGGVAGGILGSRAAAGPRTEDALVLIYRAPVRTVDPL